MQAQDHSQRAHAMLSASGSAMWIACPPSARLNEAEPEETSEYAEEGTLGHELVEIELRLYLGRCTHREYIDRVTELRAHRLYSLDLRDAVARCVKLGIELISEAKENYPDCLILLEHRVDFSAWVEQGFGSADLLIITPDHLTCLDWKFGQGEHVFAHENSQLRLYAAGAWDQFGMIYGCADVRCMVMQPRINEHPEIEHLSVQDLVSWLEAVVVPAAALAWAGHGEFNPGAKQCRWCKVRGKCRARAERNLELAQEEFRQPALMTDDEIAAIYPRLAEMQQWAHDVIEHAHKRVVQGGAVAGLKAVEGKSSRVITNPKEAYERLRAIGCTDLELLDRAAVLPLVGVTKLQRLVGAKRLKEILGDLIAKPPGRVVVVAADDKRVALDMSKASAEDDFADLPSA